MTNNILVDVVGFESRLKKTAVLGGFDTFKGLFQTEACPISYQTYTDIIKSGEIKRVSTAQKLIKAGIDMSDLIL